MNDTTKEKKIQKQGLPAEAQTEPLDVKKHALPAEKLPCDRAPVLSD